MCLTGEEWALSGCTLPVTHLTNTMIGQPTAVLTRLKPVWNDRDISVSSKIRLMRFLATSIFLYACESWTLLAELQRRIQAIEMRCYCKILHISYKDHVTSEMRCYCKILHISYKDHVTSEMRCYCKILRISYKDHVTSEEVHAKIQQAIDHTKTWSLKRDANCSSMDRSPIHQVQPKPSCKAKWKEEEDKADRGRGGKTTSGNGQARSLPSPRGHERTGKNRGNWLWNNLWCPNNPCG